MPPPTRTCGTATGSRRGITDDDVVFGVRADNEGRIYLNPQSWAMLCGAADAAQRATMLAAVDAQLESPYGVAMFAPPYSGCATTSAA